MCEFHGRWRRLWHQALSEKEALKDKLQAMGEVIIGWVQIGIWNIFQRTRVWEGKGLVLTLGGGDAIPCTASWKAAASSSRAKQDSESGLVCAAMCSYVQLNRCNCRMQVGIMVT